MSVRLPSSADYAAQVEKEMKWLNLLGQSISIPISSPIAKGAPEDIFPFPWSINHFIEGETVSEVNIDKMNLAVALAGFLQELQAIDTTKAPIAGPHNFYRGAGLSIYNEETKAALLLLKDVLPVELLSNLWESALSSEWSRSPVWLHGDIAPGNLLVKNNTLAAVIDFGIMGVGDPSCDYAIAWTFFDKESRNEFLKSLDTGTINRARGWALWKALITYTSSNPDFSSNARHTIKTIIESC